MLRLPTVLRSLLLVPLAGCFNDPGPMAEDASTLPTSSTSTTMGGSADATATSSAGTLSTTTDPSSTGTSSAGTSSTDPSSAGTSSTDPSSTDPSSGPGLTEGTTEPDEPTSASTASTWSASSESSTLTPGTGDDASTGGPSSCGGDDRCVPPAPAAWDGPFLRLAADGAVPAPTCPALAGTRELTGFLSVDPSSASCDCSCVAPPTATCTRANATNYYDNRCADPSGGGSITESCSSLGARNEYWSIAVPLVDEDSGECMPELSGGVPEPMRQDPRSLCAPPAGPACEEDRTCLPGGAEPTHYCIAVAGDLACPSDAPFPEREVIYTSIEDTRRCSDCTCGGLTGTCTAEARVWAQSGCSDLDGTTYPADGTCQRNPAPGSGILTITAVDASCPPEGGAPIGSIEATGAVTLCCGIF